MEVKVVRYYRIRMSGEKFIPFAGMESKALQRPFNQQLDKQLEAQTVLHDNIELRMSTASTEFSHHSGSEKE